jgi:hypothetical protein
MPKPGLILNAAIIVTIITNLFNNKSTPRVSNEDDRSLKGDVMLVSNSCR